MRRNHLFILLVAYFVGGMFLANVHAATINAQSCSLAHVQVAVNTAARGDTVVVPAGTCTWTGTLNITKSIILQGAGIGATTIKSEINDNGSPLIRIESSDPTLDDNVPMRVTGFTLDLNCSSQNVCTTTNTGFNCGATGIWVNHQSHTPLANVRIHNNSIIRACAGPFSFPYQIRVSGNVYGVIDSNTFSGATRNGISGYGWGSGWDNYSWNNERYQYGSEKNIFFEDNTFTETTDQWGQAHPMGTGGKYVARYNTYNQNNSNWRLLFDIHGQGDGYHAGMGLEAYGNRVNVLYNSSLDIVDCRGGKTLAYYNRVFTTGSVNAAVREQEADNKSPTYYLCPSGTLYEGSYSCSPSGQPQHTSSTYIWNNRKGASGSAGTLITFVMNRSGWLDGLDLVENVHYWDDNTSCTGTSCTSGVGCGSSIPKGTCTEGTTYWKTNQSCSEIPSESVGTNPSQPISGTLYKCGPANQWTPYYTPYTYPHPLRGGEGKTLSAPKGFKLVS